MTVTWPTATPDAENRLDMDSSRLLCDDGHSASCRASAGKSQGSRGLTEGLRPVWMLHGVSGKKTMEAAQIKLGISAWAASVVGGAEKIALREQCPESLVEVTGDEWR